MQGLQPYVLFPLARGFHRSVDLYVSALRHAVRVGVVGRVSPDSGMVNVDYIAALNTTKSPAYVNYIAALNTTKSTDITGHEVLRRPGRV